MNIGGLPIEHASVAAGPTPGLFEIKAKMSPNVQPGNQVPVHMTVGGETSQDGVTLVIR